MSKKSEAKHTALLTVLRNASFLIESGWVQHEAAVTESGARCTTIDPEACRWCITGAVSRAVHSYCQNAKDGDHRLSSFAASMERTARILIRETIARRCPSKPSVPVWNDATFRTQDECVSVIRETIDHVDEALENSRLSFLELS